MSSASFAVTYTSVYTDSEPGRVFWGTDEELSNGGSPRVIVSDTMDSLCSRHYVLLIHLLLSHQDMFHNRIQKEYEDDELEDGPADYPMDGGDDDDGDSFGDDADDEDEDEEEEHLALADAAVVVPTVEPVSLPEGT
nr:hypothetical protein [Tanacetum cinerariifolium]